jgi:ABC-type multidrug transport system fused ATPase/permease subunit
MGKYNVKRKEEFVLVPGREALPGFEPKGSSAMRLLGEAKTEWRSLLIAILALFAASGANLAIPALFGQLIDSFSQQEESSAAFTRTIIYLIAVSCVNAVFSFVKSLFFERAGERMVARLRNRVFEALLRQEIGFFDQTRSAGLVSNVQGDSVVLKEACTSNIATALRNVIQILGGVFYLCSVSWKLTLLLVVVIFPVALLTRLYGRKIKEISKKARQSLAEAADVAEESLSGIRTVRSFAAESKQQQLYNNKTEASLRLGIKAALANGLFSGGTSGVISLCFIGVVFVGGRMVLTGELTTGGLTSFLLYGMTMGGAVGALGAVFGSIASAMGATERIYSLLDRIPLVDRDEGKLIDPNTLQGGITFENVSFEYPSRKGEVVLRDVSFNIPAGSTVAFVGASGGGKSTILSLIEKFYQPSSGRILIDGQDLSEISGSSLRRNIGLVLQDCALFATTLRENIAFGAHRSSDDEDDEDEGPVIIDDEKIVAAAKAANAWGFIQSFQKGLDTVVGERGQRLSGGQRQRVAVARCFLMEPRILLLDEATSSLDASAEAEVQAALSRLIASDSDDTSSSAGGGGGSKHKHTVVIVAHRLSTIRNADIIFVLNKGTVVASGKHEELLQSCSVYSELVKKQMAAASTLGTSSSSLSEAATAGGEGEEEHVSLEMPAAASSRPPKAATITPSSITEESPSATEEAAIGINSASTGLGGAATAGDDEADSAFLLNRVADTLSSGATTSTTKGKGKNK